MEPQTPPRARDFRSFVDTSSPFRSVKEAVAVFGERLLVGEIFSPKPYSTFTPPKQQEIIQISPKSLPSTPKSYDSNQNHGPAGVLDAIKKLESELESTKVELKVLKKRETETEIALASLNAELHKNMAKLAEVEAAAAKKAAASFDKGDVDGEDRDRREKEMRKELVKRMENNPTLAHILSISEDDFVFGGERGRKVGMKKKPIVPLVGDWFFKKKGSSSPKAFHSSLYGSPHFVFN